MTLEECKVMRQEMNEALEAIAAAHGMTIEIGNMTYNEFGFNAKMIAKKKIVDGKSAEQAAFDMYCKQYGFSRVNYLSAVEIEGKEYALVGFLPKARKYSCLLRARDGKEVKATPECVIAHMVCMDI